MRTRVRWALFFAGLALVVRLPFLFGHHVTPPQSDNEAFVALSKYLLANHHFGDQHFYTPGYPGFLAILQAIPGRVEDVATIVQHLIGVGVVAAIVLIGWRYFGGPAAVIAATLAAVTPVMVVHEHTLLPDFIFGVLVFAGAIVLVEATRGLRPRHERPSLRLLALTGLLFGIATWLKPAGEFLVVAAIPALLFATRDLRRTLVGAGVVALAMAVVVTPWVVRNATRFDVIAMNDQGGRVLYFRVFDLQQLPIPVDQPYGRLVRDAELATHPLTFPQQLEQSAHGALIERAHKNDDTAGDVEQSLALTAIRRHPIDYVAKSWRLLGTHLARIRSFDGKDEILAELHQTNPPVPTVATRGLWHVARALTDLWWIVSLNALAGLLLLFTGARERRRAAAVFISVWLALSLGTVMSHGGLWRYAIQLAPITWLLGSAGAGVVVSGIATKVRRRTRT